MMDRGQDRTLLDEWVGGPVRLVYMGTLLPDSKRMAELRQGFMDASKWAFDIGSPQAFSGYVVFEAYNQFGIEVRTGPDPTDDRYFVSWGAVLTIDGPLGEEDAPTE